MASERRLSTLSRHLAHMSVGSDVHPSTCSAASDFDPQDMYKFLVRDNLELRARIFKFLEVGGLRAAVGAGGPPQG